MTAFAYYRLPYLHHAIFVAQHQGEPEVLSSVAELNGKEGFVIAPFSPSSDCPVLLIHPDESRLLAISDERTASSSETELKESISSHDIYAEDFECFHRELEKGTFRKIVLARKATLRMADKDFEKLFMKACRMYPRLFVSLVCTPQSGMWLMATPEILLRGEQGKMQTMSLAGTQKAEPSRTIADYPIEGVEWSLKNREEQQYVTDYIEDCIRAFSDDYQLKGPYTTMAANLYHLRTDITFLLRDEGKLGDVIHALYPTPAVCGLSLIHI